MARFDRLPAAPAGPFSVHGDLRQEEPPAVWRRHTPSDEPRSQVSPDAGPRPVATAKHVIRQDRRRAS